MKIDNAIKKLSKYGKVQNNGVEWWIERGDQTIGFLLNGKGPNICCENTKVKGDDKIWPHRPERYFDNLTQAINSVLRQEKKDFEEENIKSNLLTPAGQKALDYWNKCGDCRWFPLERSEKVKTDPRASGKSSGDHKPLSEKREPH